MRLTDGIAPDPVALAVAEVLGIDPATTEAGSLTLSPTTWDGPLQVRYTTQRNLTDAERAAVGALFDGVWPR